MLSSRELVIGGVYCSYFGSMFLHEFILSIRGMVVYILNASYMQR